MALKGILAELLFGNIGVEILTYVRNDNLQMLQQVGSVKSASGGRYEWFFESNREELENNPLVNLRYVHKRLNISGNLTKDTSPQILRRLSNGNTPPRKFRKPKEKKRIRTLI